MRNLRSKIHPGTLILVGVGLLLQLGCSGDQMATYPASGVIRYPDGTPLVGATIEFRTVGKSPAILARGKTDDNGNFALTTKELGEGAVEGEHQAIIIPDSPRDTDDMTPAQRRLALVPIDLRYHTYESSGLRFAVGNDASQNHFSITVHRSR